MPTQLTEEERRWVVIGLCLTKVLTPALRKVLETEMLKWYNDLCQPPTEIDKQDYRQYQRELSPSTLKLKYQNINNNDKASGYDYAVKDPLSLAKLCVRPYMCHFTGFDKTMDSSVVLSLISEAAPFINMGAAAHAKNVRKEIRNAWVQCNFADWTEAKFDACFQDMDTLLKSINLSSEKEEKLCNELRSWKDAEFGQPVNMQFITRPMNEVLFNKARLSCLISIQGKDTLRMCFDFLHPPDTLSTTLNDHRERLETLHERGVITPAQMNVLFPPFGVSSFSNYDLSLLFILLQNICGINPPASTGSWDENPPTDDTSPEADLVRIKFYRNQVFNNHDTGVSEDDFDTYWDAISGALERVHRHLREPLPTGEIEGLKTTPFGEDYYKINAKLVKLEEEQKRMTRYLKLIFWSLILVLIVVTLSMLYFFVFDKETVSAKHRQPGFCWKSERNNWLPHL